MIICHCNVITRAEIEEAVEALIDADPWRLIVPGSVYKELGKRGKCCGCFPGVVDIIVDVTERRHQAVAEHRDQGGHAVPRPAYPRRHRGSEPVRQAARTADRRDARERR